MPDVTTDAAALVAAIVAAEPQAGRDSLTSGRIAWAVVVTMFAFLPLGVSLWALLDAVRRPQWAWALSRHRQVPWLVAILFGLFTVVGGLLVSGWYLARVRPAVAAVERGEIEP